jgi:hypothetical protein
LVKNPNPDAAKHKEIPVWNAENWLYEDFEVGKTARSIRRTISEGESMAFNALVLDMHPYVADDVFAKEEGAFGRRRIAGAMVFSLGLGLMAHNKYPYFQLRLRQSALHKASLYRRHHLHPALISKSGQNTRHWAWSESHMRCLKLPENWCSIASICKP